MTAFDVELEASAPFAHRAVAVMKQHGLEVDWTPPVEERGIEWPEMVVSTLVAVGFQEAFNAAKAEIKRRWPQIVIRVRRTRDEN